MDYATLTRQVKWLSKRGGHTPFSDADLNDLVNRATRKVYTDFNEWDFAKSQASATAAVDSVILPEDCYAIYRVRFSSATTSTDYSDAELTQFDAHDDFSQIDTSTYGYYLWGVDTVSNAKIMKLINCPDSSRVTVWYYKRPPTISTATSAEEYPPDEICDLIVYTAALETTFYNEDTRVYQIIKGELEQKVSALKAQQWKNLNYNQQIGGWVDSSSERYEQELELD